MFSKSVNLMPHFTEADAAGIVEDSDDDEKKAGGLYIMDEKEKEAKRKRRAHRVVKETKGGCNFTMPELEYLNAKPELDYLKKPIVKKVQIPRAGRSKKEIPGIFVQPKRMEIKPFTEDDFRVIVNYAKQKRNKKASVDCRAISHLSDTRLQKVGTF